MDISQLEVLLAVAQEHGFSRAASKLYRTQPAISQSIRRLEDELGEVLFDRSSKDGTLTTAGELLVEYAQQMLNIRYEALGAVKELKDLNRGKVTIAANEYTVMYLLPLVTRFHRSYPKIKVEIKRSLASRISSEIIGRTVELGIVSFHPNKAMLRTVPVIKDDIALIVSPGHDLAKRKTISVRELGGESFIGHIVSSPYREKVESVFKKARTDLNISIELPTLEAIKRLVERGVGVALVPRLCVETEVAAGRLIALTVREMRFERQFYLIYRKGAKLSYAARALIKLALAKSRAETEKS